MPKNVKIKRPKPIYISVSDEAEEAENARLIQSCNGAYPSSIWRNVRKYGYINRCNICNSPLEDDGSCPTNRKPNPQQYTKHGRVEIVDLGGGEVAEHIGGKMYHYPKPKPKRKYTKKSE